MGVGRAKTGPGAGVHIQRSNANTFFEDLQKIDLPQFSQPARAGKYFNSGLH